MRKPTSIREDSYVGACRSILAHAKAEQGISHPGMRGTAIETLIIEFINQYLPQRFGATSGLVIGADGSVSSQTDVIIYEKEQTSRIPTTSAVIPAEAVVGTIEVKTKLRSADIHKAIKDCARLKSLPQGAPNLCKLHPETKSLKSHSITMPWLKQSTILSLWSDISLDRMAQYWHQHYTDVRFGYQIDSILCLDRGHICLACSHPGDNIPKNAMSNVPCVSPGIDNPKGPSVLLWPLFTRKDWKKNYNIAIGPRVLWPVGSVVQIAITECTHASLGMWFRLFLGFLSNQSQLREGRTIAYPKLDESFPFRTFCGIPLAIAANAERVEKDGKNYVLDAVSMLFDLDNADINQL
jgi:hypothetical protein